MQTTKRVAHALVQTETNKSLVSLDTKVPIQKQHTRVAVAKLPTSFGDFEAVTFSGMNDIALIKGEVKGKKSVLVRIHSECLTGDAFGSKRCDCQDQLHLSLSLLAKSDCGALLYLRQEGRGIGLHNKIRTYELQEQGLDTVEANRALGFQDDERTYDIAAFMLNYLGVSSIKLMTNNPEKVISLKALGVVITERIPIEIMPSLHNANYLKIKKEKMGHFIT